MSRYPEDCSIAQHFAYPMKSMLHTALGEIQDIGILEVVQDLCHLRNWRSDDYVDYSLFNLLEIVVRQDPKSFRLDRLAVPVVLHQKMSKLENHGIHQVCRELNQGDTMEQYGNVTLLDFFKKHFDYVRTPKTKFLGLTPHEHEIRIIQRRRDNAS